LHPATTLGLQTGSALVAHHHTHWPLFTQTHLFRSALFAIGAHPTSQAPGNFLPHLLLLSPRVISLHNARFSALSYPRQWPCIRPIGSLSPQPHRSTQPTHFFGLARNAHLFISSNQAAFSSSREYCGAVASPQHSKLSLSFSELSYGCPVALHVRTNLLHSRSTRDDRS